MCFLTREWARIIAGFTRICKEPFFLPSKDGAKCQQNANPALESNNRKFRTYENSSTLINPDVRFGAFNQT